MAKTAESPDSRKEIIFNTQYNAEPALPPIKDDSKAKNSRTDVFKRLLTFCKPEAPRICIGFIALGVNAATNLSFPYILGRAVDSASSKSDQSVYVLGQTAGIFLVGSLASWIRLYCLGTATDLAATRLRKQLFESYIDMNVEFFDTSSSTSGELVSVLEKDVDAAAVALTDKLASGLRSLNSSINGSLLLYYTSPRLCAVSLAIVPLVGIGAMIMSKFSRKVQNQLRDFQSETMSFVLERFAGITTVKLNSREKTEKDAYAIRTDNGFGLSRKSHFGQGAFISFIGLSTNVSLMAVLYVGGGLIATGEMTPGSLTQFAMQSAFVCLGFSGLTTFYSDMVKAVDAAKRVFDVIDKSKEGVDRSSHKMDDILPPKPVEISSHFEGNQSLILELKDVNFVYSSRPDRPVLRGVSLKVLPRCITAICGKSGSGKSTLLGLISGLLNPTKGSVLLKQEGKDDSSIQEFETREFLRSQVGVVEQSAGLLSGSIRDNIVYGKEGATDDEIEKAARSAAAHDFITSFPEGYDTQVGAGGSLLSGGQRARVALARALVKDPACLLLDEATAALDKESEEEIVRALQRLSAHKSVIVFTHSELLMQAASVVHIIEDGGIVSSAPYDSKKANIVRAQ